MVDSKAIQVVKRSYMEREGETEREKIRRNINYIYSINIKHIVASDRS